MKKTLLALGMVAMPACALAAPNDTPGQPGYTFIQADYLLDGELEGSGRGYDGFALEGSLTITPRVFVNGRFDRLDSNGRGLDADRTSVGVGANGFYDYGGRRNTGLGYYAQVSYEGLMLEDVRSSDDADAHGYGADIGLRWMVDPQIEINPNIGWVNYGGVDGDVDLGDADGLRYGVRVLGYVTNRISLQAGYHGSDIRTGRGSLGFDDEFRLGARLNF